jgi:flagellar biosynthesis/type III secretory pathway chaperone
MPMNGDQIQQLLKERESLLGLLTEAENGRTSAPHYDGMKTDPIDASIEATRAKLARVEALLAGQAGEA